MNIKAFITIPIALLAAGTNRAQGQEAADSLTHELREAVITARQPATRLIGSTLVTTIPGSNLSNLGNALDVLAQLPMIKVEDNTVSVIGKKNIEIYIDGRPLQHNQELQQILSSNLKKVELLMAPGAAYGSTTDAVLRITTKRKFIQGLSLSDQFLLQKQSKWSVMDFIGLNYRAGSLEFFLDGAINRNNSRTKGTTTNTLVHDNKETVVGSRQDKSYPTTTGSVKAGFNYAKDTQSFGAYYRYNPEYGHFTNNGAEWLDDNAPLRGDIGKRTHAHSHLTSLYYENIFSGKYLLHFDGDFRLSQTDNSVTTSYPESTNKDVSSTDLRKSALWAGKLYLNFPLCNGNFTVGTQDSYTKTTLDYRMLSAQVGQYLPSSLTDARQTSAAAFASWSQTFGKFSLSAGARYEYVDYDFKIDGRRDENISRRDHLLTPDVSLGYSFNDDAQISLSYKMTTVKPPYSQLTGALYYTGRHEIEGGNPTLRDEKMHDVQLLGMWNGFMLQADFTHSEDTYAFVKQVYPADNLQLLMHPVNVDVAALNLYLAWNKPVHRWTPNITIWMYQQWLDINSNKHSRPIFSYFFDNTFALPHGWTVTANMSGSSSGDMHTNRFGANLFSMNASIGKTLLNKSLTIKLSATDVFNTANYDWTMNTYGIFVDKRQDYDRHGISFHVIYNLHPRKNKYKGTSAAEAEMKRL